MSEWDIVIVGGGASGLVAAGAASRHGARVLVLEKMPRVARKVGLSGKGRGNVTNRKPVEVFIENYRRGGDFLRSAFAVFFVEQTIELLERRQVPCVTERGDRVFPQSGKAGDVVQALYRYARSKGGAIRPEAPVSLIAKEQDGFLILSGKEEISAQRVIIATGGMSYPGTGSTGDGYRFAKELGHRIIAPRPALVPLTIEPLVAPAKIHLRNVGVTLLDGQKKIASAFGEALLEHDALGGPTPIDFAREIPDLREPIVALDFKPALDPEKLDARLRRDLDENGKAPVQKVLDGLFPQALIPIFNARLGWDLQKKCAKISRQERLALAHLCKDFKLKITGTRSWNEAIVTAGGVALVEVNPRTMESRIVPGLYLCGELLDIDGLSGGYNMQAAFSTGYVAGVEAARRRP